MHIPALVAADNGANRAGLFGVGRPIGLPMEANLGSPHTNLFRRPLLGGIRCLRSRRSLSAHGDPLSGAPGTYSSQSTHSLYQVRRAFDVRCTSLRNPIINQPNAMSRAA